jgi:hypothetical protein
MYKGRLVLPTVCPARQESINISNENKHVQSAKLGARPTLQAMIKVNVCCVQLAKRLHELAVQSVEIVVRASMVMAAKNVK